MNKNVWILYPCAARKTFCKAHNSIMMMEQYAHRLNYNVRGHCILEKSYLTEDDYLLILFDMKNNNCDILLLENIHMFCRNDETIQAFIKYMDNCDIQIHSIHDEI